MTYPLISQYVESILSAEDNFGTLTSLRPVLDADGKPVMTSGNFAVVFKMKDVQSGKLYAVKCFLKDQPRRAESYRMIADELEYVSSMFLTKFKYLDNELFVDSSNTDDTEFPVLLMDWVEGVNLDQYLRRHLDDTYALRMLAYQFCKLAMWLLPQPFAHGDIKPDNIMVRNDGSLVLIDYDGMYVPAMAGQEARELGSPDFRHPLREVEAFNEHIDDFSLASMLLSLRAIAACPSLLDKYGAADRLLFSEADYREIHSCRFLKDLYPSADNEINTLVSLFTLALAQGDLSKVSFCLLSVDRPQEPPVVLSTEVTEEDEADAWEDEYGAKYSKDRKRLIEVPDDLEDYEIRKGTKVICDKAFSGCSSLQQVTIPDGVTSIGDCAFEDCSSLQQITLPDGVTIIGEYAFGYCSSLQEVTIPVGVTSIGKWAFEGCSSLQRITIPASVTNIGGGIFTGCKCQVICRSPYFKVQDGILYNRKEMKVVSCWSTKQNIVLPDSVTSLGESAFWRCSSLQQITLPVGVTSIGASAFWNCSSLQRITLPVGVTSIGKWAFEGCSSLQQIMIPDSVTSIGNWAFWGCSSLQQITLPDSVTSIGESAFWGCSSLQQITIPDGVTSIGESAFRGCSSLQQVTLPVGVTSIGESAFRDCSSLQRITLPDGVTSIGARAFRGCTSLQQVTIPDGVTSIGESAFWNCSSLQRITLPDSVTSIGGSAFSGCSSLQQVTLPDSVTSIGKSAFWRCSSLQHIYVSSASYERIKKMLLTGLHSMLTIKD